MFTLTVTHGGQAWVCMENVGAGDSGGLGGFSGCNSNAPFFAPQIPHVFLSSPLFQWVVIFWTRDPVWFIIVSLAHGRCLVHI